MAEVTVQGHAPAPRPTIAPFTRLLGATPVSWEGGSSEWHFAPGPDHLNTFGVVHGGACMTLLDATMSAAARSVAGEMGAVTLEMKTSFMRPSEGALVARAKVLHRTRSLAFVDGTIHDSAGHLCCHATGTFRYVPRVTSHPSTSGSKQA